jgi:hypothetical protein
MPDTYREDGAAFITTKMGDTVVINGKPERVIAVKVYRESKALDSLLKSNSTRSSKPSKPTKGKR